jgi:hypothetical protein
MITVDAYFMGRRARYRHDLTPAIEEAAVVTVAKANQLLTRFRDATDDNASRGVRSGWRPPAVNAATPGASKTSGHMRGEALDIEDNDEALDAWLMTPAGEQALRDCGLWHEHPRDTPTWAHVQTFPPGSGNLHFYAK